MWGNSGTFGLAPFRYLRSSEILVALFSRIITDLENLLAVMKQVEQAERLQRSQREKLFGQSIGMNQNVTEPTFAFGRQVVAMLCPGEQCVRDPVFVAERRFPRGRSNATA